MGISFSCPFAESNDVENAIESVVVKSISFGDDEVKTPVRTVSFGRQDMEAKILESTGSGGMTGERSVSFKGSELEKMISFKAASFDKENDNGSLAIQKLPIFDPNNPKHQAAVKLQKVYKSFRTRRKLADCAVLVEQSWWKLLDFAELKRSSISFFDIEKHETAISRWSRARTRAAKVGKGLSKNDKAQKLALQHWLEAIDPRHRYGHNLHFYYCKWLHSKSREPFFYWLDIGEGREVNLIDKCPRAKLQQQCIKYLGPMERKAYEVVVEGGKFFYKQSGEVLHTTGDAKWIFVLSTSKTLYVGKKKKGTFQHSSFLAGGVATAAGRLVIERGILKAVWPHSGHYRPTEANFQDFLSFLRENNVDLTDVKTSPEDEEDGYSSKLRSSKHLRSHSSDEDFIPEMNDLENEEINSEELILESDNLVEEKTSAVAEQQKSSQQRNFKAELTNIEIPKRDELLQEVGSEIPATGSRNGTVLTGHLVEDGYETADEGLGIEHDETITKDLFGQDMEVNEVENIPREVILKRINSKKETRSYQLGKQLSCKWTTGAGPRIGCVRDYPSELQFQALEQVNLSPRSIGHSRSTSALNRKNSTLTSFGEAAATTAAGSPIFSKAKSVHGSLSLPRTQSTPTQ